MTYTPATYPGMQKLVSSVRPVRVGDSCLSEGEWDDPEPMRIRLPLAPWRPEQPSSNKEKYQFPWAESAVIEDATEEYTTHMRRLRHNHTTGMTKAAVPEVEPQHRPWPGGEVEPPVPIYIGPLCWVRLR